MSGRNKLVVLGLVGVLALAPELLMVWWMGYVALLWDEALNAGVRA